MKQKCIFLDRDGVLNVDRVDYVYRMEEFIIPPGVGEALKAFKEAGYLLIIITNQSGIAKGIYRREDVMMIHQAIQYGTGVELDDIYFCPYHEKFDSHSLTRKPGSLMIEKLRPNIKLTWKPPGWWAIMNVILPLERVRDCVRFASHHQQLKQKRPIWLTIY